MSDPNERCDHRWRALLPSGKDGEWLPTDLKGEICWRCKAVRGEQGRIIRQGAPLGAPVKWSWGTVRDQDGNLLGYLAGSLSYVSGRATGYHVTFTDTEDGTRYYIPCLRTSAGDGGIGKSMYLDALEAARVCEEHRARPR